MYAIETYNHETEETENRFEFSTKREANNFLKTNCEKLGYDWFCKINRSLEYCVLY